MTRSTVLPPEPPGTPRGVAVRNPSVAALQESLWQCTHMLHQLGLDTLVDVHWPHAREGGVLRLVLQPALQTHWMPDLDTARLTETLGLDTRHADDLAREILLALLASPEPIEFPDHAELAAAVRMRQHLVQASRTGADDATTLAPPRHPSPTVTQGPAPPHWSHTPGQPPTLKPGHSLIAALTEGPPHEAHSSPNAPQTEAAPLALTQAQKHREAAVLLAIATEAHAHNAPLYRRLQRLWERQPLQGAEFDRVFMRPFGPQATRTPRYHVPGDRVWFQPEHPDETGSPCAVYLGGGQFTPMPWPGHPSGLRPKRAQAHPRWVCLGFSDIILPDL